MNIGIISFRALNKRFSYEEKRLKEEAIKKGHKVHLMRYQRCMMTFEGHGTLGIRYGKRPFPEVDLIIPRASVLTNAPLRTSVVEHLQLMGLPMLNEYNAILRAKNKLQTLQILSHYEVPVVKTAVVNNSKYLKQATRYIGTFPIIMKTTYGSYGNGVAIVESQRSVKSTYGILSDSVGTKNIILLQEYIAESEGKDIRLFVVNGEVIATMQRSAEDGDFRSNVGQGGSGMGYTPTEEEIHMAVKATKALGLEVSGVDIIQTKNGPAIMEVNANPGFKELEEISGVNVAGKIIEYSEKFAQEYVAGSIV
ncbi:MAG: RimK family alpha-L-glutamate ligase [Candidatus Gracilibacteria bacterium]|nr:RimK family alpha-L-glutamate ligase [Candidatus Gracilibacteria bacterium]